MKRWIYLLFLIFLLAIVCLLYYLNFQKHETPLSVILIGKAQNEKEMQLFPILWLSKKKILSQTRKKELISHRSKRIDPLNGTPIFKIPFKKFWLTLFKNKKGEYLGSCKNKCFKPNEISLYSTSLSSQELVIPPQLKNYQTTQFLLHFSNFSKAKLIPKFSLLFISDLDRDSNFEYFSYLSVKNEEAFLVFTQVKKNYYLLSKVCITKQCKVIDNTLKAYQI